MFFYKSVNDNEQIVVADREPSKLPTDVYGDPMALIEDDKEIISRVLIQRLATTCTCTVM